MFLIYYLLLLLLIINNYMEYFISLFIMLMENHFDKITLYSISIGKSLTALVKIEKWRELA